MKLFHFGLVGTGTIAHTHAQAIQSLPNAQLVTCFSRNEEKCEAFAQQYTCDAATSLQALVNHPDVSVVLICTPSGHHLEAGLAAIQAGKHVLLEKPIEITLDRCDELIRQAQQAKVYLGGIFQSRYTPAVLELKKALEAGRFGKLTMGDAIVKWYRTQAYYDSGVWRGTWELDGGGALMNQSIHAIDLLQWLMGPVDQIQAMTATLGHERIEVEDTAYAILRFKNGALGSIQGTTTAYPGFLKRIEISGTHGSVVLEDDYFRTWQFKNETEHDAIIRQTYGQSQHPKGTESDPSINPTELFAKQIAAFLHAINTQNPYLLNGEEARKAVAIILGIYESARSQKPFVM
jgi:predicted dehydrogenase